jgi:hypothetical protein
VYVFSASEKNEGLNEASAEYQLILDTVIPISECIPDQRHYRIVDRPRQEINRGNDVQ